MLSTEKFPEKWPKAILVPVFKMGTKIIQLANYRGIAIGSNICKLFYIILNCRLNNFCLKRNIICPEQIRFCKGKRTCEHIFVLTTLIDEYTQSGTKRLKVILALWTSAKHLILWDMRNNFLNYVCLLRLSGILLKLRLSGISDLFYHYVFTNISECQGWWV